MHEVIKVLALLCNVLVCFTRYYVPKCEDHLKHYLHEGLLIQIKNERNKTDLEICINSTSLEILKFNPEQVLKNVTKLGLFGLPWPSFDMSNVKEIFFTDLKTIGMWKNCSQLEHIYIRRGFRPDSFNLANIPPAWLTNCKKVRSLDLRNLYIREMRAVIDSAPTVEKIVTFSILDIVDIAHNPLFSEDKINHQIKRATIRYTLYAINPAKLVENSTTTFDEISVNIIWQVSSLPNLEYLSVPDTNFDFCAPGKPPVKFPSLKYLSLPRTNTKQMCLSEYRIAPQLTSIEFTPLPSLRLQFRELFSTPAPHLDIDFTYLGQVVAFEFTRDDYLALNYLENKEVKKGHISLFGFRQEIECDCGKGMWFARALRTGLVTADDVFCTDDRSPKDLSCEWIDCDRIYCDSTCICCREGHNAIRADCRDVSLRTLPESLLNLSNLTRIIAPNNSIMALPDHIPYSLIWADLSGNNILWKANASAISLLFSNPARRVRLARNSILCSCDNKPLINLLQNFSHQIEDYEMVTCAVTNMKLGDVAVTALCAKRDRDAALLKFRDTVLVAVVLAMVLAAITVMLAVVLYYRRREIQIFLFARGWCLCCVREEELDANRRYDVFISFCHEDSSIVLNELFPPLDQYYSVCVHFRDWYPGEKIPTQITMSVEQSRRTIVVMSRNFIRSLWGCLEFQTAHVSGLVEGRVRVVMVILDDVLETDDLSLELRSYVRLNTYVRWGDPWFWEKLRYALPHQPTPKDISNARHQSSSGEQNVEMNTLDELGETSNELDR